MEGNTKICIRNFQIIMIDTLRILDDEAVALKTNCIWRNQEIDNVRQGIVAAEWYIRKGMDPEKTIESVRKRLKILKANPDDDGNHEQYKSI